MTCFGAIETNSRNDGAGRVNQGEDGALVRIEGSIRSIDDIKAIVVDTRDGVPIRVNDVARVQVVDYALWRRHHRRPRRNGRGTGVLACVAPMPGSSYATSASACRSCSLRCEERFHQRILRPQPAGWPRRRNRRPGAGRSHGSGHCAAVAVSRNWRASLVIALSLPLSIMIALIVMRAVGMSANLMSLGGLAIAIGMLIDALVVVVENIVGNLSKGQEGNTTPLVHIVFRSVCEVLEPVSTGVLIIIIVFVPLLALQGLEGKLFIPVALAIIFALAASLLLALTVIPVATSFLLRRPRTGSPG